MATVMRGYYPRTCVRCGAVVKGTIRRQYCSPKCKVYAYRERKDAAKAPTTFEVIPAKEAFITYGQDGVITSVDRVPAGEG